MPTYNGLNVFLRKLLPPGLPEDDLPIEYLLDYYQLPENIWNEFNKDKTKKEAKTIFFQMKALKKRSKIIPKNLNQTDFDPLQQEEFTPKGKIATDVLVDVGKKFKTIIFTLCWVEKIDKNLGPEYEDDLVSNLIDIIENTESRTQLAIFIKGITTILNDDKIAFNQEEFKKDINLKSKQKIELD